MATLLVPLLDHESDAVRVEAFYALAVPKDAVRRVPATDRRPPRVRWGPRQT